MMGDFEVAIQPSITIPSSNGVQNGSEIEVGLESSALTRKSRRATSVTCWPFSGACCYYNTGSDVDYDSVPAGTRSERDNNLLNDHNNQYFF
jgi:hypothetical protein